MRHSARALLAAFRFLTRLPLGAAPTDERALGRSVVFFPLVGLSLGAILLGVAWFLETLLPLVAARLLVLLAAVALYGAFHLDGLADTCDGLYGGRGREEALRRMRDPHVGAMGAIALVAALGLKGALLAALAPAIYYRALLLMPFVGHGFMALALALPYARQAGLGLVFARHRKRADRYLVAGALVAGVAIGLGGRGGVALAVAAAATGWLLLVAWRRLGGVTGDICGAASEVAECAFLLGLLLRLPGP